MLAGPKEDPNADKAVIMAVCAVGRMLPLLYAKILSPK